MKDSSLLQVGGTCTILVGITGILSSLVYLLLPAEQRLSVPAAQILPSYLQAPLLLNLEFVFLTLIGVFGLGAVPAITRWARPLDEGWVTWTGNLALLGFAVDAVSNFLTYTRMPGIATAFVAGSDATKAALVPIWRSSFDLDGMWGYGAIGVWVFVVSLLAWRAGRWPRLLSYLGMIAGLFYLLIVAGFVFKQPVLFLIVSAVGTLAASGWYIWFGLILRREAAAVSDSALRTKAP